MEVKLHMPQRVPREPGTRSEGLGAEAPFVERFPLYPDVSGFGPNAGMPQGLNDGSGGSPLIANTLICTPSIAGSTP